MRSKLFNLIKLVLFNSVVIYFAFKIYFSYTTPICENTVFSELWLQLITFFFFVFLAVLTLIKRSFIRYKLGVFCIFYSVFLFLFFYLNKEYPLNNGMVRSKVYGATHYLDKNSRIVKVAVPFKNGLKSLRLEVSPDNFGFFDSVDVQVQGGFFGLNYFSNIEVSNNYKCDIVKLHLNNPKLEPLDIGHKLTKNRCFSRAIKFYTYHLPSNLDNPIIYQLRAENYLLNKEYSNALIDYLYFTYLEFNKLDFLLLDEINGGNLSRKNLDQLKKLIDDFNENHTKRKAKSTRNNSFFGYKEYKEKIVFCIGKMNELIHEKPSIVLDQKDTLLSKSFRYPYPHFTKKFYSEKNKEHRNLPLNKPFYLILGINNKTNKLNFIVESTDKMCTVQKISNKKFRIVLDKRYQKKLMVLNFYIQPKSYQTIYDSDLNYNYDFPEKFQLFQYNRRISPGK